MREAVADEEDHQADLNRVEQGAQAHALAQRYPQQQDEHARDLDDDADGDARLALQALVEDIPRGHAQLGGEEAADAEAEQ